MVPASLTRPATHVVLGERLPWRPSNVPLAVSAETRLLVLWGALLGGLGVIFLLGHVWVRNQVVEAGYQLSVTRQLVERLGQEERELAVRAAAAEADGRLEEIATERLGMRRPARDEEGFLP